MKFSTLKVSSVEFKLGIEKKLQYKCTWIFLGIKKKYKLLASYVGKILKTRRPWINIVDLLLYVNSLNCLQYICYL